MSSQAEIASCFMAEIYFENESAQPMWGSNVNEFWYAKYIYIASLLTSIRLVHEDKTRLKHMSDNL